MAEQQDITFHPSTQQMRVKAMFWSRFKEVPGHEATPVNLALIAQYTGDSRVHNWWALPGFKEWITESDTWKIDLELLLMEIPYALREILHNEGTKSMGPKVNAAKLIVEAANRMPAKVKEVKLLDRDVGKMDQAQLKAIIRKGLKMVGETPDGE